MSDSTSQKHNHNPVIRPLILVLAGLVFSYLGIFYFNEIPLFDFLLVVMGFICPLLAVLLLWRDRHMFTGGDN